MPLDLSEALAHHRRGDLERARPFYEAAVAGEPSNHVAHHLLGLVTLARGDHARALALLGRAVTLRPDVADYHAAVAEVYWSLGQVEPSIASGRECLRLDPNQWKARCNLGTSLLAVGQLDAAVELFREAIRLKPDFAQGYNNLGHALQLQGKTDAAVESFRAALRLDPTSGEAHANLGKVLLDRGQNEDALKHCLEASRLRPDLADSQIKLGNVYLVLARSELAEACFRRAIQLSPGYSAGHACLGGVLEHLGDAEQSLVSYREALRLEPRNAWVLAKLATRFKDKLPEADQAAIEQMLAWPGLVPAQRLPLLYGLVHVFDARGEFDRAARTSIEANARQQEEFQERGLGYNRSGHAGEVDQLIHAFTPDFFERVKGWGLSTERPVFVVGMPRSGTSLVEQILASHSRVFGAGELNLAARTFRSFLDVSPPPRSLTDCLDRLDPSRVERLARSHLDFLDAINTGSDRIIDKMPENTIFLGLMAALFPNSRVVYCRRDSRDTALSCWMTHFGHLRWSCDARNIVSKVVETDRIMNHWREVLPVPIHEVVYEELVENLEAKARELVAWAGLDWEPACLDFHKTRREVRTASVLQVRQPIYRGSVGRWKNYERSLGFLFDKLGAVGTS